MSTREPLLARAFTDGDDAYNFSMGCVAQRWPDAIATYRYINRDPAHRFAPGFESALRRQLELLSELAFSDHEFEFFRRALPWLPLPYLQWLRQYRFDPGKVQLLQRDGRLHIEITGRWYETIYWEVKLLSIITELANTERRGEQWVAPLPEGWESHIHRKAEQLSSAGVQWIDFGTRRRYSYAVHDAVVRIMKEYPGFRGTSNPHLAMKHGVKATGTYAHQLPMAMQALYGARSADRMAMQHWAETYRGNLGIALSDTLTTTAFLRVFDSYFANLFTGVRQDSGDPFEFGERMIAHYQALGIDPITKVIVFSDALTPERAIALHRRFEGRIRTTMGIGTNLTADPAMTGRPALNHVIKLVRADFGDGPIELIKLSDDEGKATGDTQRVAAIRTLLDL